MKSFAVAVLVLALTGFSSQQDAKAQILQFRNDCIKDTKVEAALVERADKGDFADDDKLKCFAKCFYNKQGFIDDQGKLLTAVLESKLPPTANKEESLAVIKKCEAETGANDCETAFKIHVCFFNYLRAEAQAQAAAAAAAAAAAQSPAASADATTAAPAS